MTEAAWALIGVVVGALATGFSNRWLQTRQFSHDKEMSARQIKSAETATIILTEMLNHHSYTDRSFDVLKKPIGGYTDDEIRQFLLAIGAKRTSREDGTEWWYLLSRSL